MGILRGAMFIIGGAIGAGFITGAELVRFFGGERFVISVVLSAVLFFFLTLLFLNLGKKYGGTAGVLRLFGRGACFVRLLFSLCALVSAAGMLAGLDGLLPRFAPLLSLLGLFVAVIFVERGTDAISKFNFVLVPLLLCFLFFYAAGKLSFSYPSARHGAGGALYAGMNVLFLAPVLMDAGEKMKCPALSSALAAAVIGGSSLLVLARIVYEGAGALNAPMPFLYAAGGRFFPIAVALAIMTSLVSSLYTPLSACGGLRGKKKYAAKGGVLLTAFLLSRMGLTEVISVFYPLIGGAGLFFSALCILYDQLFKKHHEKVHPRGEHA